VELWWLTDSKKQKESIPEEIFGAIPGQDPSVSKSSQLGPLHTRAKSRDHEIVRAQKKVSKGRPNTPPKSYIVVTDLQV
jgi:hypothetical protein